VRYPRAAELPPELHETWRKAVRLEWISLAYWLSAVVVVYFTLGQSQAMKAAWVEDILGLVPPIAFLVAARFRNRDPTGRFPWGYHRSITVAYVVASLALFALGAFLLIDSVDKLIKGTHPPIGMVEILEGQVWLGWLMLAALAYSGIPAMIIGFLKRPLAKELHDKVLFADAKMNQADWLTASAAMLGVVGIGFGLWWADAAAAIVISLDILHDGQKHLRESVADIMDDAPKTHDEGKPHPLIDRVKEEVAATSWVREAVVRLREDGHLITGDVWVVPGDGGGADDVERLVKRLASLDWKLHDLTVTPVASIEEPPEDLLVRGEAAGAGSGAAGVRT
jgi:cation diffusion facilitator family transporter